jgi:the GLUG motif
LVFQAGDYGNRGRGRFSDGEVRKVPLESRPALGHDWEPTEVTYPTCTEDGLLTQVCIRCSTERTIPDVNAPAQGHQYVDNVCLVCKQAGFALIKPSGSGSSSDPYQLSCAEHLYWLADLVNSGNNSIPYVVLLYRSA